MYFSVYFAGIDSPRKNGVLGKPLPSARVVSNKIHRPSGRTSFDPHLTVMHMSFGQFLDHDIVATPLITGTV